MDRDLLEKLLTAQVLALGKMLTAEALARGVSGGGDRVGEAIRLIRREQADVIRELLAPPPPETGDS